MSSTLSAIPIIIISDDELDVEPEHLPTLTQRAVAAAGRDETQRTPAEEPDANKGVGLAIPELNRRIRNGLPPAKHPVLDAFIERLGQEGKQFKVVTYDSLVLISVFPKSSCFGFSFNE
jgi:hypothetical protein